MLCYGKRFIYPIRKVLSWMKAGMSPSSEPFTLMERQRKKRRWAAKPAHQARGWGSCTAYVLCVNMETAQRAFQKRQMMTVRFVSLWSWCLIQDLNFKHSQGMKELKSLASRVVQVWCPTRDSNSHALRHMILSHACLPVPPVGQSFFLGFFIFLIWSFRLRQSAFCNLRLSKDS